MTSLEEIINWIFGGQVDASKIVTILVGIYAVVKSITEWAAKKKFNASDSENKELKKELEKEREQRKQDAKEFKQCMSMLADVVLTAYLSSNTIPEETKKTLGYIGTKLDKVAGIELQPVTQKLIDVAENIVPAANLQEHKEELMEATEVAEQVIDDANEVVQQAIDKIKVS